MVNQKAVRLPLKHFPSLVDQGSLYAKYLHRARRLKRDGFAVCQAKHMQTFRDARIKPDSWSSDEVQSLPYKIVTTAKVIDGIPIPEVLVSLGGMTREDYNALLGSVRAVIGLGVPTISPTVYSSLHVEKRGFSRSVSLTKKSPSDAKELL